MSPQNRHVACNCCRERKVKCNGEKPYCKRCCALGSECVYTSPMIRRTSPAKDASQSELTSDSLTKISTKPLSRANSDSSDHSNMSSDPNQIIPPVNQFLSLPSTTSVVENYFNLSSGTSNEAITEISDFAISLDNMDAMLSHSMSHQQDGNMYAAFTTDVELQDLQISGMENGAYGQGDGSYINDTVSVHQTEALLTSGTWISKLVPPEILDELYRCYFSSVHRLFPMVNKDFFHSPTAAITNSNDILALKCAMCVHAANISPRFKAWASTRIPPFSDSDYGAMFYREAKNFLERAGTDGPPTSSSLFTLQATILVALYELRLAYFSQAWVTVSRSTWLSQMLQLHKLDSQDASNMLQIPTESNEMDEARATLWAVITLNSFMGVGVSWNVIDAIDHSEISTHLPRKDHQGRPALASLRLDDALKRSASWPMSIHQGATVAATLCAHTISHVKSMNREDPFDQLSYNFWTQHYRLDETIQYVAEYTSNQQSLEGDHSNNASELMLRIMLKATSTCLHQAVITKGTTTKGTCPNQIQRSVTISLENAIDIAKILQTNELTETIKANIFLPWSISVALQALIRRPSKTMTNNETHKYSSNPQYQYITPPYLTPQNSQYNSDELMLDDNVDTWTDAWTNASTYDSISILRHSLRNLKSKSPLSGVFYDEVEQELAGDEPSFKKRPVGLVNFPSACVLSKLS